MSESMFVFIDEGGNTGFKGKKTRYFTFTAAVTSKPVNQTTIQLERKRYELMSFFEDTHKNRDFHYFHANNDNKYIKQSVYEIISTNSQEIKYISIIANKEKVFKPLQDNQKFYYKILFFLVKYIVKYVKHQVIECRSIIIVCDELPGFCRNVLLEDVIINMIKGNGLSVKLMHHKSSVHSLLQVVDYVNHAIFQKWESSKVTNFEAIKSLNLKILECFK